MKSILLIASIGFSLISCGDDKKSDNTVIIPKVDVLNVSQEDVKVTREIENLLSKHDKGICNVVNEIEEMEHQSHVLADKSYPISDPRNSKLVMDLQEKGRDSLKHKYQIADSFYIGIIVLGNKYCNKN